MTLRQPVSVDGLTQASRVMPLVRSSELASATVTRFEVPLKDRAPPYLPPAVQLAPVTVPLLPVPDASLATVPDVSLNENAATSPETCASEATGRAKMNTDDRRSSHARRLKGSSPYDSR